MGDKTRGIYPKFIVARTDGTDQPGCKHDGCDYFVLDKTHDKYAAPALAAYADACEAEYPLLARDIRGWLDSVGWEEPNGVRCSGSIEEWTPRNRQEIVDIFDLHERLYDKAYEIAQILYAKSHPWIMKNGIKAHWNQGVCKIKFCEKDENKFEITIEDYWGDCSEFHVIQVPLSWMCKSEEVITQEVIESKSEIEKIEAEKEAVKQEKLRESIEAREREEYKRLSAKFGRSNHDH